MPARCPSCSAAVAEELRSCVNCGALLASPGERAQEAVERRLLTVLFADLVGSTQLSQALDPEDMRDVLRAYQQECAGAVERWGGHVAQYLGDGILIYFGYPAAHEDDARRAVGAALEIVELVPRIPTPRSISPLQVRLGVHTGVTVVGSVGSGERRENLAVGGAPNVAARVQGVAVPNTVVVTGSTRRLVDGFYLLDRLGQELGGVAGSIELYQVMGTTGAARSIDAATAIGLTQFVGRAREVATLNQLWSKAMESSSAAILIRGEAGIGKSRIVQELKVRSESSPVHVMEWHCSQGAQGTPLRPVAEALARQLGIVEEERPSGRLQKLQAELGKWISPADEATRYMALLLSIPLGQRFPVIEGTPQAVRKRTLDTIVDLLQAMSAGRPLLLVVEDLHWADPSTLDLARLAIDRLRATQTLIVLTSRPEFRPEWKPEPELSELWLEPLPPADVEEMIRSIASRRELPLEVLEELTERSEGVPLFVEEITRTVLESGVLADRGDHYELLSPLEDVHLPYSIQASLLARLDRLGSCKRIAQVGSAIGRTFSYDMIRAVDDESDADLRRDLAELVKADLLAVIGDAHDAQWTFKHALIRDAAYDSFLRRTRRQLHRRIAETLIARFPDVAANEPEVVAGHLEGAGLTLEAVEQFRRAGERALSRSANREAIAHFQRALHLLRGVSSAGRLRTELALQLGLAPALMAIKGWGDVEVEVACHRALDLSEELGAVELLPRALWGLWTVHFLRANLDQALAAAERVRSIALTTEDPLLHLLGHHAVGFTRFFRGELLMAREHAEQGIALFDIALERELVEKFQFSSTLALRAFQAAALWMCGDSAGSERELQAAEALAQQLAHPPSVAFLGSFAAYLAFYRRDYGRTRTVATQLLRLSEDEGYALWIAVATVYRGWANAALGDVDGGIAEMKGGLEKFGSTGSALTLVHIMAAMGETLGAAGRHEEAITLLDQGLKHARDKREHLLESELHRLKAETLFSSDGDVLLAERCARQALSVAHAQGARALVSRANETLYRLLLAQGRDAEATLIKPGVAVSAI